MAIPKFTGFFGPVLQALSEREGSPMSLREVTDRASEILGLTEEEKLVLLPSSAQTVAYNRVSWALKHMQGAGWVDKPGYNRYRITDSGSQKLAEKGRRLGLDDIKDNSAYAEWKETLRKSKAGGGNNSDNGNEGAEDEAPEDLVEVAYGKFRAAIEGNLLLKVQKSEPDFLENLIKDLLLAMGYGNADDPTMARVTSRSRDGGIDAVIDKDRLGLGKICIQAKRYTENSVRVEAIKAFETSVRDANAKEGVFVTTSDFTKDAIEQVEKSRDPVIVAINGKQLAKLMVDHNVGVLDLSPKKEFRMVRIDEEYFRGI